jgi:membrane protease YdiL (CAAX protease family)
MRIVRVGIRGRPSPREVALAETRLNGTDKRALMLWIVLGILGALFAHKYFFRAFPEASIDFKVSRAEAQKRAKEFVVGLGENLNGYQSTIVFDVDENAKTYLERELGLQQANRLMSDELNIWYWEVRFFRPQQEEEFQVRVSPAGKVVTYDHKIEEARGAKSLNRQEAQVAAQGFLQSKLGTDLNNWNFLPEEANSQTRPNRVDWSFTWERKNFKAKDAPYRLVVGLQGNQIGSTQEFLQVPEAWSRDYKNLRSRNDLYEIIAIVPYILLLGAVLWLGISLTRQDKTTWGAAIKIGLFVAALFFLMQFNQWDSYRAGYDTKDSYASFVTLRIVIILASAFVTALTVTLVLPGGEPLYRSAQPERLRLYQTFSRRGLLSKEFFCSSVVGLSLAAAHIGFIVAFYMVGSRFGVWAPQDTNYSEVFNTSIPWIAAVAIGVTAATSEEFLFRLFAIPFLHKLTGSRILAVVLPAFFWGFLHSNYPQEPGYIRGIEVGLIGIVAGMVMLQWGIVATLIWHYTVDASLVGLLLIRSDNLYFKISGVVLGLAAVAPLAWSGISYLLRGRFEPVDDLLNGAEAAPEIDLAHRPASEGVQLSARRYTALTAGAIGFLALCVLAGGLLAWRIKRESIGDYLKLSADSRTAVMKADAVLREHGLDANSFRKGALFVDTTNPAINEYLRRRMSIAEINKIYADRVPGALWRVRYFRDSQAEEFAVTLKPDGSRHGFWHTLPEAAKGATLGKEEAVAIAENYLREKKQIDVSGWKLVESSSDKRPNRTDHTLTWQENAPLDSENAGGKDAADHAYARMDLHILGNEPTDYRTYVKIPDEFERKQDEQSLPRTLFNVGRFVVAVALAIVVLIVYFTRSRRGSDLHVPWRRLVIWGLVGLAAYLFQFLLGKGIPEILADYSTAYPWKIFLAGMVVRRFIGTAFWGGILVVLFGLAWHFAARAFGEERVPTWLGMPANYYRDAFWIGLGGSGLLIGLQRLLGAASLWWPTLRRAVPSDFGSSFDALVPAGGVIGGAIYDGLLITGVLAVAVAFIGAELRVRWLRLLLFFALAAAMVTNWGSPADFLKQFLGRLILLTVVVFGIRWVARFNLLGWFLVIVCTGMLRAGLQLTGQPDAFYRSQGYIVLTALGVLLVWPLVSWRLRPGEAATEA